MDQTNEQNPNSPVATIPAAEAPPTQVPTDSKPSFMGKLGEALGFGMMSPKPAEKLTEQPLTTPAAINPDTAAMAAWEGNPGAHPQPQTMEQNPITAGVELDTSDHPHSFASDWHAEPIPASTAPSQPEIAPMQTPQPFDSTTQEAIPSLEPMQNPTPDVQTSFQSPTIEQPTTQVQPAISETPSTTIKPLPSITPDSNPDTSSVLENTIMPSSAEQQLPVEQVEPTTATPVQESVQTLEPTPDSATAENASFGSGLDPKEPFADVNPQQPDITTETPAITNAPPVKNSTITPGVEISTPDISTPISPGFSTTNNTETPTASQTIESTPTVDKIEDKQEVKITYA